MYPEYQPWVWERGGPVPGHAVCGGKYSRLLLSTAPSRRAQWSQWLALDDLLKGNGSFDGGGV